MVDNAEESVHFHPRQKADSPLFNTINGKVVFLIQSFLTTFEKLEKGQKPCIPDKKVDVILSHKNNEPYLLDSYFRIRT